MDDICAICDGNTYCTKVGVTMAHEVLLIRCYKGPIFHKMSISIPGMIRLREEQISGGCVYRLISFTNEISSTD